MILHCIASPIISFVLLLAFTANKWYRSHRLF